MQVGGVIILLLANPQRPEQNSVPKQKTVQMVQKVPMAVKDDGYGVIEEILTGKNSGEGCKTTLAYISHVLPDDLQVKRDEFWETKMNENKQVWYIIKEAVCSDEPQCAALLEAAGFKIPNGNVQKITISNTYFLTYR